MDITATSFYCYWGKSRKGDEHTGDDYHLLPYHSLDVAVCGWWLLSEQYSYGKGISQKLDISPSKLQRLFAFLLSLHDLGKFSRAFQNLVPNQSESLVEYIEDYRYTERHESSPYPRG